MKFSQYNYVSNLKDGFILFNVYNSKYAKINNDEDVKHFIEIYNGDVTLSADDSMVKALYDNGYIVDDDIDEYAIVQNDIKKELEKTQRILEILIYTTDQCNFRCEYCPQDHRDTSLSQEHWHSLYKFIEKGVIENKYDRVFLSFYGGEPLIEIDKIFVFLAQLKNLSAKYPNVVFDHQITTNAYLLSPEIYDKLVSYNVTLYQITVDGFSDTHDVLRHLVNGKGTWDRIIDNLKYINTKNDDAQIVLRTNFNESNVERLEEFQKWEKTVFSNPKFYTDYEPISKFTENVPNEHLAELYSENYFKFSEKNVNKFGLFKKFSGMCKYCYANTFTVKTNGMITRCENLDTVKDELNEKLFVGKLCENGNIEFNNNDELWDKGLEIEECKTCLIYPICGARSCVVKKILHPDTRPDCTIRTKSFKKRLEYFIENKI